MVVNIRFSDPYFTRAVVALESIAKSQESQASTALDIRGELIALVEVENARLSTEKMMYDVANARLATEKQIYQVLQDIHDALVTGPAVILRLVQTLEGKEITGMVTLTDVQKYTIRIKDELDVKGNPVQSAGPFSFAVSDSSLGAFTPDADGLGGSFAAAGPLGSGTVTATDSSNNLQGVSSFTIIASAPVSIELQEGTPEAQ